MKYVQKTFLKEAFMAKGFHVCAHLKTCVRAQHRGNID